MLMVVFGAGASYDSAAEAAASIERHAPSRPPLTYELFSNRGDFAEALREFVEIHTVVPQLRNLPSGTPLEQFLADLQAQSRELRYRQRELTALRYYLRRILTEVPLRWFIDRAGITNYSALLFDIQEWQARSGQEVAFVTFNYDLLLDRAFEAALDVYPSRHSSPSLEEYVDRPPFYLFKPHGSVDWVRLANSLAEVTGGDTSVHKLISNAARLVPSDEFEINDSTDPTHATRDPARAVLPALAVPVNTKTTFECPGHHIAKLLEVIPQVTQFMTIGWRGTERAFLDLWGGQSADLRVYVVSPSDPAAVAGNLTDAGMRGEMTLLQTTFSDFVTSRTIRPLLGL